jgi:chromosome segregation ATPase
MPFRRDAHSMRMFALCCLSYQSTEIEEIIMEYAEAKVREPKTFIADTTEESDKRQEIVTMISTHRQAMEDTRNGLYNQLQEYQERIDIIRNTIAQIDTHLNDVPVDSPAPADNVVYKHLDRHYS